MRISVIIPAFDAAGTIGQALHSVLNQTRPADEVIVVDDGSRDDTAGAAAAFQGVEVLRQANAGAPAARIAGEARATGEALMFLDADDLLGPTALDALARALSRVPGGIAACPWRRYEREGDVWLARPASAAPRRPGQDALAAWLTGAYVPPCALLWSRRAYRASGGWDRDLIVNQDGDLAMRALAAGVPLVPAPGGLAYYRRPDGPGATVSGRRQSRDGLAARLGVLDRLAERLNRAGRLGRYRAPLAEAYRAIAAECPEAEADLRARALRSAGGRPGPLHRARRRLARGVAERSRRIAPPSRRPELGAPPTSLPGAPPPALGPLVSVVIPTHDRAHVVGRAIRSVLEQTYRRLEVIVVDDASSDGTAALVQAMRDHRLRYLRQPRNGGVARARNRGMAEARGAYIAFLDSDDRWMPDKLARQIGLLEAQPPRVGLAYCGLRVDDGTGPGAPWTPTARGDVWADMLADNVFHHATSGVVMRREVAEFVGGFDPTLPANEDHDYWVRAARFFDVDFVADPLIVYDDPDDVQDGAPERRSRNVAAKTRAREMFVSRHGADARAAGRRHLYFTDGARRLLEEPGGDPWLARRLLLKALRDRPAHTPALAWLALSVVPRGPRAAWVPRLRRLRAGALRGGAPA